jgi:hypothetical protein
MKEGTVWSFETARFTVRLDIERDWNHCYDGDDEDGETQAKLDSGEYVAFDSRVVVELDGEEIGVNYLGASVYGANDYSDFWTAHRGNDPMDRNCSVMRDARGHNVSICHYFPGMVKEAVSSARAFLAKVPRMREGA